MWSPSVPQITNVTYDNKGLALSRIGKFTEALECHKKSFELNGKDEVNFTNTSMALGGLGRHEEAIENCEKALEIDPNHVTAWNNKGYSLYNGYKFFFVEGGVIAEYYVWET